MILTSCLTLKPVLCLQNENLNALPRPQPSLLLRSSENAVRFHNSDPEQVAPDASVHSSASGASCSMCPLSGLQGSCAVPVSDMQKGHGLCGVLNLSPGLV